MQSPGAFGGHRHSFVCIPLTLCSGGRSKQCRPCSPAASPPGRRAAPPRRPVLCPGAHSSHAWGAGGDGESQLGTSSLWAWGCLVQRQRTSQCAMCWEIVPPSAIGLKSHLGHLPVPSRSPDPWVPLTSSPVSTGTSDQPGPMLSVELLPPQPETHQEEPAQCYRPLRQPPKEDHISTFIHRNWSPGGPWLGTLAWFD